MQKDSNESNLHQLDKDRWWQNYRRRHNLPSLPQREIRNIIDFLRSHRRTQAAND